MREWMVIIDAVVQGAPEDAPRRKQTVNNYFAKKHKNTVKTTIYYTLHRGYIIIIINIGGVHPQCRV